MSSAIKYTINHRWAGKTVDIVGRGLSFLTRGRYRTGLTRLAYKISTELNQLPLGERINLLDGKITASDGRTIIEDPLLKVGKDFGQIPVTKLLCTTQGMAKFLRSVYLKSERWGINIHHKFTPEQEKAIRHEIDYLNEKLDIGVNINFPLFIKPSTSRSIRFLLKYKLDWSAYSMHIGNLGAFAILPFELPSALRLLFSKPSRGLFHPIAFSPTITMLPSQSELETRTVFSHEYMHFLEHNGYIQNDSIAEGIRAIREHELTGEPPVNFCFFYGLETTLENLFKERIYVSEHEDTRESYIIGGQLGGFATQLSLSLEFMENESRRYQGYTLGQHPGGLAHQLSLSLDTGDPSIKWRFMSIASKYTSRGAFLRNLQQDATFRNYLPS